MKRFIRPLILFVFVAITALSVQLFSLGNGEQPADYIVPDTSVANFLLTPAEVGIGQLSGPTYYSRSQLEQIADSLAPNEMRSEELVKGWNTLFQTLSENDIHAIITSTTLPAFYSQEIYLFKDIEQAASGIKTLKSVISDNLAATLFAQYPDMPATTEFLNFNRTILGSDSWCFTISIEGQTGTLKGQAIMFRRGNLLFLTSIASTDIIGLSNTDFRYSAETPEDVLILAEKTAAKIDSLKE